MMAASSPDDLFDSAFFDRPQLMARPPLPAGFPAGSASGLRKHVHTGLNWGVGEAEGTGFSDHALRKPPHPGYGRDPSSRAWTYAWGR